MSIGRALVLAPLLPEYDRESGMQRTLHLMEFLREAGFAVSFIAENPNADERYVRALQQRGVATYLGFTSRTDQLVATGRFDLALFAFWYLAERYMPAVRTLSPTTRVVVDTIDLHFLREARQVFHEPVQDRLGQRTHSEEEALATPNQDSRGDEALLPTTLNQELYADVPYIMATPNPVPVGFGPGTTTISWSTGNEGSSGSVYVSVDGGPEKLFAERSDGSEEASWIQSGKNYEFLLYEEAEHRASLSAVTVAMDSKIDGLDSSYAARMAREVNTYAAADAVLTVSEKEANLINDMVGDQTLAYTVPDCEDIAPSALPFAERKGILFVGNFRHPPNVDAAEYLCKCVAPRLDPALTAEHPIYIVGNGLDERVRSFGRDVPHVHMVGWVPSVLPYLERVRVSVLPLLYGGGTKRKLIQALMTGTPTVSTKIGVEGLNLQDGEHVLVADDPDTFASSCAQLLEEQKLWQHLARHGREHAAAAYERKAVRTRFLKVITDVLSKAPKPVKRDKPDPKLTGYRMNHLQYQQLKRRVREVANATLPPNATVVVVSRGDNDLLKLDGRKAWHFPQDEDGGYAGFYPADSPAAIAQLEALRAKGADFLLFPSTAFWWLEHYPEFKRHLESEYSVAAHQEDTCLIYALLG